MKRRIVLAGLLAYLIGPCAFLEPPRAGAGWGAGGCAGGSCQPAAVAATGDGWRYDEALRQSYFYDGGVCVAGFNHVNGEYRAYAGGRWSEPQPPPWAEKIAAPAGAAARGDGADPFATDAPLRLPDPASLGIEPATPGRGHCLKECKCDKCRGGCACGEKACSKDCLCARTTAARPVFGVERDKLEPGAETYWLNGKPIPQQPALNLLVGGDARVPDDAQFLRLTIAGTEAERHQVLADLEAFHLRDGLVVQAYPPDHWALKTAGFQATGHPMISLQLPDGTEISRSEGPVAGDQLAALIKRAQAEAVRRKDNAYDPRRSPDLTRPLSAANVPPMAWITAALAAVSLLGGLRPKG